VPADTEFHRWLSQGIDREVAIILAANVERFADARDVRILTGSLIHGTAPRGTSTIHILFMCDEVTQSVGPITFEIWSSRRDSTVSMTSR